MDTHRDPLESCHSFAREPHAIRENVQSGRGAALFMHSVIAALSSRGQPIPSIATMPTKADACPNGMKHTSDIDAKAQGLEVRWLART